MKKLVFMAVIASIALVGCQKEDAATPSNNNNNNTNVGDPVVALNSFKIESDAYDFFGTITGKMETNGFYSIQGNSYQPAIIPLGVRFASKPSSGTYPVQPGNPGGTPAAGKCYLYALNYPKANALYSENNGAVKVTVQGDTATIVFNEIPLQYYTSGGPSGTNHKTSAYFKAILK